MADTERLIDFPAKASPVAADIVYIGDSAAAGDEKQSTIAEIAAVPGVTLKVANNLDDLDDVPTAQANLGLEIGSDVQAHNAKLDSIAGLSADDFTALLNIIYLYVLEGADQKMGVDTLVAGTVTVNTAWVSADSRIFLTGQNTSGTIGELYVDNIVAGTSFDIVSSSNTDTRDVAWVIFTGV